MELTQKEINAHIREELQNHAIKLYNKGIEKLSDRFFCLENDQAKPLGWMKSAASILGISVRGMMKLEADILAEWIDLHTTKRLKEQVKKGILIVKKAVVNGVSSLVYSLAEKEEYVTVEHLIPCPSTIKEEKAEKPSLLSSKDQSPELKAETTKETLQIAAFCSVAAGIATGAILFFYPFFSLTGSPLFSSMFEAIPFHYTLATTGLFYLASKLYK